MTGCMALEWPGRWRAGGLVALLGLPLLPAVPLIWSSLFAAAPFSYGGAAFERALANSVSVALLVALGAFAVGLPIGVLNALYDYRGRRLLLTLSMLPLLVPSFLWVVGWHWLLEHECRSWLPLITGYSGCLLVFLPGAITLVLFTTAASAGGLSGAQVDAARLAGGEWLLVRLACRHAAVPAALAAVLAAILTLSDPGTGFAVGLQVASSEILISFTTTMSGNALAGRQCLTLAAVVLAAALPIAYLAAPRLAAEAAARQVRLARRSRHPGMRRVAALALFTPVFLLTLFPTMGLIFPLRRWVHVARAVRDLTDTGASTLLYAVGAGSFAAGLGLALAVCAGREKRLRLWSVGACLTLFALPPMLLALGFVRGATQMPAWTDPVLRGRPGVCLALGMRFFPVAALLTLRSWGAMSPSLARAAGVHGVPLWRYLWRVALPLQRRAVATAVLLVGSFATSEIGMVLLLYPPGEETLPLRIFQIIGYPSPSSRLAALCAIDLAAAVAILALTWLLGEDERA
ncbi:ABC transporter permease subunit [Fimbriiglobus ruber]|uniref:Ferric iron ABC transporter, permease protein n=1 Tax=Fimbriiglobus ruber TaxID=1908690 RepID=A0A225DR64_9BACT|nr:ABC transporter permease subunit [Fimbriiglobus ruber]OWK41108.1 Ferric iron ABC transporter, permease protein [Fimbriiglobus ruber]